MSSTKGPFNHERPWVSSYPQGIPASIDSLIADYNSVRDVIEEACQKFPTKPAFSNMGRMMTYSELNRKAECFAAFLQNELKLKKGDRIALQMPNVLQYPIAILGALKAGLVIVNTNPLYTDREMLHQFNDSGAIAIVVLANFAFHLEKIQNQTSIKHVIITEIGDMLPFPKNLLVNTVVRYIKKMVPKYSLPQAISFKDALDKGASQTFRKVDVKQDDIAFLQYTGGTTGVSKGAMLSHKNIISNMQQIHCWMQPRLVEGEEIAICALPLYHIFSLTVNALAFAKYGAHNLLITNPRDLGALIAEIKKYPCSVMSGVNTLFNALMNHPDFSSIDFSTFKMSVAGGMALQTPVALRWKELTKSVIVEGYGLTETSPVVTCNPIDGTDRVGFIGLPLPSTEVRILNDDETPAPEGESGELCVRGPQVMMGYWQQTAETAKVMTKDGWLKTGDIAIMDKQGFFKIVDRKKDMILVSGFNVYPNEVEEVIASHPGVLEVAAIGVPDEHSGETVKIFVVKKDQALTSEQLITHAKQNLAGYKVPRQVEFRTELPKTNVGKILRRALRAG